MKQLFDGIERHYLFSIYDHNSNCKVENHEFVALEEENLPDFVEQAKLDDARIKRHDPLRSVHLNDNLPFFQVLVQLLVLVREQ